MDDRQTIEDDVLGLREDEAHEPDSFAQFLLRARAIGFSETEIDRLRETYGHKTLGIGDEHRSGSKSD